MEFVNGAIHQTQPLDQHDTADIPFPPVTPKLPPAKTFSFGNIVTRIWANKTHWGAIDWKVDQVRARNHGPSEGSGRGLKYDDISSGIRGLYEAKKWIRRTERRKQGSWFWWL